MSTTTWLIFGLALCGAVMILLSLALLDLLKRVERLEHPYFTTRDRDRG